MGLSRAYFSCVGCSDGVFPADLRLGIDGHIAPHAPRLVCRAATARSFAAAAVDLREFCGLKIAPNTVRTLAEREGAELQARTASAADRAAFEAAEGVVEFAVDGALVNTLAGWREVKLGVFAKRKPGEPATPRQWADRELPVPTARFAFGTIATAERFGPLWRRHAAALGLTRTADVTVLGDGAKWIWRQAGLRLPGSTGVLDVFHASQHLHACGGKLFGETSKVAKKWAEARRRTLLKKGSEGVIAELEDERRRFHSPTKRRALTELANFLAPHADRTKYRERLAEGRSIGSGLVEGACKTVVGKRLKQTGARWRTANARGMTARCCLAYGDGWDTHWSARAA